MSELFAIQAMDDEGPHSTRDPSVRIFAPNYLSLITGCPIYLVNESRERASERSDALGASIFANNVVHAEDCKLTRGKLDPPIRLRA